MAPRKKASGQGDLLRVDATTAPAVPLIREAVGKWREGNYRGISDTTRILLTHWFPRDGHRRCGTPVFKYHPFQREAIETLIYLYEVERVRRQKSLLETFVRTPNIELLQHDNFARYCLKMATGSGKTKVMSLAIAWQFFNAVAEGNDDFAQTFLVLAPNVIVYERLHTDFAKGAVFRNDPIIPPELRLYWDFECYMRGDGERAGSAGALYLTNIQQLHDRPEPDDEPDPMTAVLGPRPRASAAEQPARFAERVAERGGRVLVLNDEAHHTHDEKLKWNEIIRELHGQLEARDGGGVIQLDVTATPRFGKGGQLFTWTVFDYPLKQAIVDGIVKKPIKGIAVGVKEGKSEIASRRYRTYLTAAVERWREYRSQLEPLDKKPILFVMMNDTADADEVADFLRTAYPGEFGGQALLVIHTNNVGDVSRKDEEPARKAAREVDLPTSPVNAIVSVLMLREGWDVQNVTVIVGLRPYSSKANILPEQTLGRGLRLMFRGAGTGYQERVDVIGTAKFMELVEQLEKDEDLKLDAFELGKDHLEIRTIRPEPSKLDRDIAIPVLTPILVRKKTLTEEIATLDVAGFPRLPEGITAGSAEEKTFTYEGYDVISMEKIFEREYRIPEPQSVHEVIGYYARKIATEIKLPSQFAALAPRVKEYFALHAFGREVDLEDRALIGPVSSNVAQYLTLNAFGKALRALVVEEQQPQMVAARRLSETPPFPWSRPVQAANKTVFNFAACDNDFEKRFAKFLQDAGDVESFAKLPAQFGFAIEYTDSRGSLRFYEPDFVAVLADGSRYLVETKGREDPDVAFKDRAAGLWCENASALTGQSWKYLKVPQLEFEKLRAERFVELGVLTPMSRVGEK